MDKKAVLYGIGALVVLLILALVVKPMATGQPVNLGLPAKPTPIPTTGVPANTNITASVYPTLSLPSQAPTSAPTIMLTPVPTWNAQVKKVEFVDPGTYGVSLNQTLPNGTRIDSVIPNVTMIPYATFSGKYSGTTQIIHIPFPYWELWYTVDPVAETKTSKVSVTPQKGEYGYGVSANDISGSYSSVQPQFTLQVMDADDPNRIVRTLTPPGGINLALWLGTSRTAAPYETPSMGIGGSILKPKVVSDYAPAKATDPRPWKEKFFEGQKDYYFVINSQNLNSYKIDVMIPDKYVGKF